MPFNISMESILKLFAPFMSVFKLSPTAKILCLVLNSILGKKSSMRLNNIKLNIFGDKRKIAKIVGQIKK